MITICHDHGTLGKLSLTQDSGSESAFSWHPLMKNFKLEPVSTSTRRTRFQTTFSHERQSLTAWRSIIESIEPGRSWLTLYQGAIPKLVSPFWQLFLSVFQVNSIINKVKSNEVHHTPLSTAPGVRPSKHLQESVRPWVRGCSPRHVWVYGSGKLCRIVLSSLAMRRTPLNTPKPRKDE